MQLLPLIQTNKLKHYPSIHGDFSSEFWQPCVVFTGHPSLRFGDVVHFMELWGKSSLNTIIFTDLMLELQPPPVAYRRCSVLGLPFRRCYERIHLLPEVKSQTADSGSTSPGVRNID
ncbi:integrator complex subunit 9-like [Sinocyclocheilus anshuiensis]|uniref:integrator complex subunit 9-like n=1 Tax=Sinocyclocheilus anshuiensis TaxID=1608454 RepID=UPI0007B974B0|nr:PREDICTED: integrator complex subunit 9-like [Sinocyclocheilus anshuiensis]